MLSVSHTCIAAACRSLAAASPIPLCYVHGSDAHNVAYELGTILLGKWWISDKISRFNCLSVVCESRIVPCCNVRTVGLNCTWHEIGFGKPISCIQYILTILLLIWNLNCLYYNFKINPKFMCCSLNRYILDAVSMYLFDRPVKVSGSVQ